MTMQWLSRIAPQHPKKAMIKMILPMTINAIDGNARLSVSSSISPVYFLSPMWTKTPTIKMARPHSCNKRFRILISLYISYIYNFYIFYNLTLFRYFINNFIIYFILLIANNVILVMQDKDYFTFFLMEINDDDYSVYIKITIQYALLLH